jgi:hypothetical protein
VVILCTNIVNRRGCDEIKTIETAVNSCEYKEPVTKDNVFQNGERYVVSIEVGGSVDYCVCVS